jgi:hypothetical protein
MMRTGVGLALIAAVTVSLSAAAPKIWTITNGTFDDGGTFSGSFVYDASTNTYSSINVQTTTGHVFGNPSASTYTVLNPGIAPTAKTVLFVDQPGQFSYMGDPTLDLGFSTALTDAGGTVNLSGTEYTCSAQNCNGLGSPSRGVTGGTASAAGPVTSAPTLSGWGTAALAILLGGAGLLAVRRSLQPIVR